MVAENPAERLSDRPALAAFTGGLTYQSNFDALRCYIEEILPVFERGGVNPPQLSVIGFCREPLKAKLAHPTIRFLGYVSDVSEQLRKYQVFFAPIVSGSGIKTKVLEAMACGLPVIALPDVVSGLSVEHMEHCLVAKRAEEFVQFYLLLISDTAFAVRVGQAGRKLVMRSHSIEAATEALSSELASILEGNGAQQTAMPLRLMAHSASSN